MSWKEQMTYLFFFMFIRLDISFPGIVVESIRKFLEGLAAVKG